MAVSSKGRKDGFQSSNRSSILRIAISMNIALVGNGRSLLGSNLGSIIDSYDVVVRFNNFVTTGYEVDVGARTDWWVRNHLPETVHREEQFKKIILRLRGEEDQGWEADISYVPYQMAEKYPNQPIEIVPKEVYNDLKHCGLTRMPLTGTVVLHHILMRYTMMEIAIAGFDCLAGAPESLRHYHSEINNHYGRDTDPHNAGEEQCYLRRIAQEHNIKIY